MTLKKAPSERPCPGSRSVRTHAGGGPLWVYGLPGSGAAEQILFERAGAHAKLSSEERVRCPLRGDSPIRPGATAGRRM